VVGGKLKLAEIPRLQTEEQERKCWVRKEKMLIASKKKKLIASLGV
jgi:hypothetical protein